MFSVDQLYQWFYTIFGCDKIQDYHVRNDIISIVRVLALSTYGLLLAGTIAIIITIVFIIPRRLKK